MKLLSKIFEKKVLVFLLVFISSLYWLYYLYDTKSSLDENLFSQNKFDSVRLNKFHSYEGVKGSWNIQHQYAPYLDQATKAISLDHGTRFFINDDFTTRLSNVDANKYKKIKLNSKIDDDFILGLQHKFRLKISSTMYSENLKYFVGRYAVLNGINSVYFGFITKVTNEYVEVRAPLPMGEIIESIRFPPVKKGIKHFEALLDSERMGLVRGGIVNQFDNALGTYIYVRTFSYKDSLDLVQGVGSAEINGKKFYINNIISLGMHDFLVSIKGDEVYQPYVDSRKNIIKFIIENDVSNRELSLRVSNLTNDDYIFGLGRKYSLRLSKTELLDKVGLINFERSPWLFSVDKMDNDIITLDLLNMTKNHLSQKINSNSSALKEASLSSYDIPADGNFSRTELLNLRKDYDELFSTSEVAPLKAWLNGGNTEIAYEAFQTEAENTEEYKNKLLSDNNFKIWEIYPGSILNLYYGKQNPAPVEMMIHVLGKNTRKNYYDSFITTKPEYVSFAKPERFTPWLINWHWSFFREMIYNYEPIVDLDEFSLWKRETQKVKNISSFNKTISSDRLPFTVKLGGETESYKLYTVTLDYKINNPLIKLPLLGKSARYFITSNASITSLPASIPWSENIWKFPIVVKGQEMVTFDLLEMSDFLDISKLNINSISIQEEKIPQNKIVKMFLDYDSMR